MPKDFLLNLGFYWIVKMLNIFLVGIVAWAIFMLQGFHEVS